MIVGIYNRKPQHLDNKPTKCMAFGNLSLLSVLTICMVLLHCYSSSYIFKVQLFGTSFRVITVILIKLPSQLRTNNARGEFLLDHLEIDLFRVGISDLNVLFLAWLVSIKNESKGLRKPNYFLIILIYKNYSYLPICKRLDSIGSRNKEPPVFSPRSNRNVFPNTFNYDLRIGDGLLCSFIHYQS